MTVKDTITLITIFGDTLKSLPPDAIITRDDDSSKYDVYLGRKWLGALWYFDSGRPDAGTFYSAASLYKKLRPTVWPGGAHTTATPNDKS